MFLSCKTFPHHLYVDLVYFSLFIVTSLVFTSHSAISEEKQMHNAEKQLKYTAVLYAKKIFFSFECKN